MNRKIVGLAWSLSISVLSGWLTADPGVPCDVVIGSHAAVTPRPRPDKEGWLDRHQAKVDRVARGDVDLLMIGDSITHGWEKAGEGVWDQYFGSRNAVNLGFGGDRTEHVLWRLENGEIDGIQPKLAVLMIGTNNSNGDSYTAEQIADGIEAIVCKLRTGLPETKALILAIFPRGDPAQREDKEHGASFNDQWAKNDEVSRMASELADGEMIFFLDINGAFIDEDGVLAREVMPDLLHPNEQGYQLWAEAMEPTVAQLMGESE